MREVAVHFADVVVALVEGPAEAGQVRAPETFLGGAVQDVHPVVLGGQAVGDLAGAVGRAVVDHEHVARDRGALTRSADRLDHPLEILALVVRRHADDESLGGGSAHPDGSCRTFLRGEPHRVPLADVLRVCDVADMQRRSRPWR